MIRLLFIVIICILFAGMLVTGCSSGESMPLSDEPSPSPAESSSSPLKPAPSSAEPTLTAKPKFSPEPEPSFSPVEPDKFPIGENPGASPVDMESARTTFPPYVTQSILIGDQPIGQDVDSCLIAKIGSQRLHELRTGAGGPTGTENDMAAMCLASIEIDPGTLVATGPPPENGGPGPGQHFPESAHDRWEVETVASQYQIASSEQLSGGFVSGQEADIMLSGVDFNNTGGSLLFNHPKGIASDGQHLLLADGNNNRVLIWNSLPQANTPPDLVLGQPDFYSNNPGTGRHQMNWPVSVSTDGTKVVVSDTYNDRILIWNQFPTANATPADIVLDGSAGTRGTISKDSFAWPWGIWTDGEKLVITSTGGGYVLIWEEFPTQDNQIADIYLTAGGRMGTPRTITSDGQLLIVGDHNARDTSGESGNFFWLSFPTTDDQSYDFFSCDPAECFPWLQGDFTYDGKLVMLGQTLHVWNSFPTGPDDLPDVSIDDFHFDGGDGADLAIAGENIYISMYNGNRIVVYEGLPPGPADEPDFAIGSPDIYTNTLDTHYIITNGVPATDGKSLFVSSDFDRRLYVWRDLPDESGAYPDLVYHTPEAAWDNALRGNTLALAGKKSVYIWTELPLEGNLPEITFNGGIGNIAFQQLMGVALDDRYFYLSDFEADKVYVWEGIPSADDDPVFALSITNPWRLSSDGEYLAVTAIYDHAVYLYPLTGLSSDTKPLTVGGPGSFNLPQSAILSTGHLFVADTNFNCVRIWENASEAAGTPSDVILGEEGFCPEIGRNTLFWPAGLAFDGNYLWVGEYKFGDRLLRFSP